MVGCARLCVRVDMPKHTVIIIFLKAICIYKSR
jgi:hypothetical protein